MFAFLILQPVSDFPWSDHVISDTKSYRNKRKMTVSLNFIQFYYIKKSVFKPFKVIKCVSNLNSITAQ